MKSGVDRSLGSIGALCGDVCVCAMLLSLSVLFGISMNALLIWPWIACLIVQFAVGSVMTGKGSSVNWFLIFHIAAAAAEIVILYFCARRFGFNSGLTVFLLIAVAATGIHAAFLSWKSPSDTILSYYSDILIVALALYLLAYNMAEPELSVGLIIFSGAALVISLVSVGRLRTNEGGSAVSRGAGFRAAAVLVGILLICLLITGAVVGIASGGVHSFLDLILAVLRGIWRVLNAVFNALGVALGAVISFFARLFSPSETAPEGVGSAVEQSTSQADLAVGSGNFFLPTWVLSLIMIGAACIVLIVILRHMRHVRFKKREISSGKLQVTRTGHLGEAIRAFFRRIRDRIRFEWLYRKFRNTPQGIFLFLLRKCRGKKLSRKRDESPGGFVRRICGLDQSAEGRDTLLTLAFILDETYYACRAHAFEKDECQIYIQAINTFLGKIEKGSRHSSRSPSGQ